MIAPSTIRVLLVEDNPGDARLLQDLLKEVDVPAFHLVWKESLAGAGEALAEQPFDAILLDLSLPDGQGLESVARIQEAAPAVPVIVLTGLDDQEVALDAVRSGAQEYLIKGKVSGAYLARVVRYSIERKRLEEERRRLLAREREAREEAEAAVERARRATRQRDEVLGMVTHDLRSPLTGIALAVEAVLRGGGLTEAAVRTVSAIRRETDRMNRLLQNLLDVAMVEAGHFAVRRRPTAVAQLLEDATELLRSGFEERELAIELRVPADLPHVPADPDLLERVLSNLLTNALHFTPDGGRIRIAAEARDGAVCVSVEDSGPGIAPEEQEHLFDRFWRPSRSRRPGGTGLGLTIARGIVAAHGGRIWVESEPGVGSAFHFTIPLTDPVSPPGATMPASGSGEE
jgi:phosphoserine phosphatase RsbU/P